MKQKGLFVLSLILLLVASAATAADFDWVKDLTVERPHDRS